MTAHRCALPLLATDAITLCAIIFVNACILAHAKLFALSTGMFQVIKELFTEGQTVHVQYGDGPSAYYKK